MCEIQVLKPGKFTKMYRCFRAFVLELFSEGDQNNRVVVIFDDTPCFEANLDQSGGKILAGFFFFFQPSLLVNDT